MTLSKITKQKSAARASFVQKLNQAYEYATLLSDSQTPTSPKPTLDNVIALMGLGEDVADEFAGVARLLTEADREKVGIVEEMYCAFETATGYDWFLPRLGEQVPGGLLAAHNVPATMAEFYEMAKLIWLAEEVRTPISELGRFAVARFAQQHGPERVMAYRQQLQSKLAQGIEFDTTVTYHQTSPGQPNNARVASFSHRGDVQTIKGIPVGTHDLLYFFSYAGGIFKQIIFTLLGTSDNHETYETITKNIRAISGLPYHEILIKTPPEDCTATYHAVIKKKSSQTSDVLNLTLDNSQQGQASIPINPLLKGWIEYRKHHPDKEQ